MPVWEENGKWRYRFQVDGQKYNRSWLDTKEEARAAEDYHKKFIKGECPEPSTIPILMATRKAKPITFTIDQKGCFICISHSRSTGYPQIKRNYKQIHLSHVVYEAVFGPIKPGNIIIHVCDNPSCINPLHLRQATHEINYQDMLAKDRHPQIKNPFDSPRSHLYKNLQEVPKILKSSLRNPPLEEDGYDR